MKSIREWGDVMDTATYNQYKAKIQQAEKLQRQIKGLQSLLIDMDEIQPQLQLSDDPVTREQQLTELSRYSGKYRHIQIYFRGTNARDYSAHEKADIPVIELSLLIAPYLNNVLESLLDSKIKELEEL